eukprot:3055496-Amphidinium_carterae.1
MLLLVDLTLSMSKLSFAMTWPMMKPPMCIALAGQVHSQDKTIRAGSSGEEVEEMDVTRIWIE